MWGFVTRLDQFSTPLVYGGIGVPILAAFVGSLGFSTVPAFSIAIVIAAIVMIALAKRDAFALPMTGGARVFWLALGALAIARVAGTAVYMMDASKPGFSAMFFDPFYYRHNCFSAWWHAARLAVQGIPNVYRPELYEGWIGRFKLDEFNYPTPTLLIPRALLVFSQSFFTQREAWFAIEAGLFIAAFLAVAFYVRGEEGRRVLWVAPAVVLATPILLTLQIGNFQLAALALAMLAMVAFEKDRNVLGGAALAFAALKIFPGILVFLLILQRRWKAVLWTAVFGIVWLGLTAAWIGPQPVKDFVQYQAPRIGSGEPWAFLEIPELKEFTSINQGIPGLVLKARFFTDVANPRPLMHRVSNIYSLLLAALAIVCAFRINEADRLSRAQIWMGLLALAALQSPFVPDAYGLTASIWLWALIMPRLWQRASGIALGVALWLVLSFVMPNDGPLFHPGIARLAVTTFIQCVALALAGYAVLQRVAKPAVALVTHPNASAQETV